MVFLEILIVLGLTVLNGVFAMSELALVSARRVRLGQLAAAGRRGARAALRLIEDPSRFLATVQIGITLVGILAGAFSGATLADRLGDWLDGWPVIAPHGDAVAIGLVVVAIAYLSLVVGELVPKRIALRNPERIAALVAPPMNALSRAAAPAVALLRVSTDALLALLRLRGTREATITEDEVKALIDEGTRAGIFVPQERAMIEGVLRLADRAVRVIMTPRREVAWVDERASPDELRRALAEHPFSRFPVCRGSVDHVVGIVHAKDLLQALLRGESVEPRRHMSPPLVVHERMPVLRLLDLFRREGVHIAVAVDEFGALEGVVTSFDILEGVAGELPERGEEVEPAFVRRADGSWLVDGAMPIDEFEDRSGLRGLREQGDFATVAGFVLQRLGHLPEVGESFEVAGHRFEVVDMDERRIDRVLVQPPSEEGPVADAEA